MKLTKFRDLPGASDLEKLTAWSNGRPIYTQVKHNGIFCEYDARRKQFKTRQDKYWDTARFPEPIREIAEQSCPLYLYGELLVPDLPLAESAGLLSVNSSDPFPAETTYLIFDCFNLASSFLSQPFAARTQLLTTIPESTNVKSVLTYILPADKADAFFHDLPPSAEGVVYRRDPYFYVDNGAPHPDIVKRKRLHTAEGICKGVTEGKGKRRGMCGFLTLLLPNGKYLDIGGGPGCTDAFLTKLWNHPPLDHPVTFSYEEMSAYGIPLRPQIVAVRNYE